MNVKIILIHTSVKLVTHQRARIQRGLHHFNPHEREARDVSADGQIILPKYFNPHEREARDKGHPLFAILF